MNGKSKSNDIKLLYSELIILAQSIFNRPPKHRWLKNNVPTIEEFLFSCDSSSIGRNVGLSVGLSVGPQRVL